ncbi:MAG TPA: hypothetical protein VKT76_01355 [Bradyrhizobium sp.]|nr:hypothetical protein [Bradyrhizobium sp.]
MIFTCVLGLVFSASNSENSPIWSHMARVPSRSAFLSAFFHACRVSRFACVRRHPVTAHHDGAGVRQGASAPTFCSALDHGPSEPQHDTNGSTDADAALKRRINSNPGLQIPERSKFGSFFSSKTTETRQSSVVALKATEVVVHFFSPLPN